MSSSNCCFLTCIQISQVAGQVVYYSHLLKNFPQFIVIHTVKGFGIITLWQIDGETVETVRDFILGGSKITADGDFSHEIKMLAPWKKSYDNPKQHIKMQRYYFADKGLSSQSYGFYSSHVWM